MRSSRVGVCLLVVLGFAFVGLGDGMRVGGGWRETSVKGPRGEVEELARFAVDEHNKNENSLLEFVRVVKAKEQVVAGILHQLTLEVMDGGKKKFYEVKVWVKPWMNFKQLQEFKLCDHETKTGGNVISYKMQMEH